MGVNQCQWTPQILALCWSFFIECISNWCVLEQFVSKHSSAGLFPFLCLWLCVSTSLHFDFWSQGREDLCALQMQPDQHNPGCSSPETRLGRGQGVSLTKQWCKPASWGQTNENCILSGAVWSESYSFNLYKMSWLYRDGEWDFNWCDVGWLRENFDHTYMEEHVRICHFRNHYEVSRSITAVNEH